MKKNNLKFTAFLTLAILLTLAFNAFGQDTLSPVEFVGTLDGPPESQSVSLQVGRDARIEVSDDKVIRAELRESGEETSELVVTVNTDGLRGEEDSETTFEGKITVSGSQSFIIPINIWFYNLKVPKECRFRRLKGIDTYTRGTTTDNFVGAEASFPSPYLTSLLSSYSHTYFYDTSIVDSFFGDSFSVGTCRACGIRVQMRLRNNDSLGYTDSLATGLSDASNLANHTTAGFPSISPLWASTDPVGAVKNVTLDANMTPTNLNTHLMNYGSPRLDVWMQDDTSADYTVVRVFRY
jgi:hypothetical protein